MKAMVANPKVIYNGEYSELVNVIEKYDFLNTRINVMAWIIEHKDCVDRNDFNNVKRLCDDGFIRP